MLCLSLSACVVEPARPAVIHVAPPSPPVEVVPAPRPGYVWDRGHWNWREGRYVWIPGHWRAVRVGYHWVPGHWAERHGGWVWVEGHWAP
ncbi:MAG: YXWGXW repeat-containing protein [Bordetella sp.]|uniref:YXWGXW repeat-containing protein n=1 Tax=Bordetella sp. TaxID=28081 RepID=UPI003F7BBE67